jgi:hypothetical protein
MDVKVFKLPTIESGVGIVEQKYIEVLNKYRSGEVLDPEVIDWMDYANNVLLTSED